MIGPLRQSGDFMALDDEARADGYALKLFGAVRLTRAAWPHLRAACGAVVNIAGVGGRVASADFTIGGSVNAALMNLTKALADRGVADGARVNCVNPGSVRTDRLTGRVRAFGAGRGWMTRRRRGPWQRKPAWRGSAGRRGSPPRWQSWRAGRQPTCVRGAIPDLDGGWVRAV